MKEGLTWLESVVGAWTCSRGDRREAPIHRSLPLPLPVECHAVGVQRAM